MSATDILSTSARPVATVCRIHVPFIGSGGASNQYTLAGLASSETTTSGRPSPLISAISIILILFKVVPIRCCAHGPVRHGLVHQYRVVVRLPLSPPLVAMSG